MNLSLKNENYTYSSLKLSYFKVVADHRKPGRLWDIDPIDFRNWFFPTIKCHDTLLDLVLCCSIVKKLWPLLKNQNGGYNLDGVENVNIFRLHFFGRQINQFWSTKNCFWSTKKVFGLLNKFLVD
jgi:hypothetical protein